MKGFVILALYMDDAILTHNNLQLSIQIKELLKVEFVEQPYGPWPRLSTNRSG